MLELVELLAIGLQRCFVVEEDKMMIKFLISYCVFSCLFFIKYVSEVLERSIKK